MFRFSLDRWYGVCVLALTLWVAGCAVGTDDATRFGKTGKVAGTLTYAGNVVKDARVQFSSPDTAAALIGVVKEGKFAIEAPVPVGNYKVVVLTPTEPAPEFGVAHQPKEYPEIPLKYRDEFNSDLTATVKEGNDNKFTFDMKP